jgi:predicted transposase/invertase (TIGR01784 family)
LKAKGEEEIKMVAERDPVIKEAYCKLQEMSEDEATRMIYEARLKAQRDEYSRIQGALHKGREEERGEAVKNLLDYGMNPEQVSQALRLSPETVRQYLH